MVKLNQISDNAGAHKSVTRLGRGIGSGKGKTAGRGHKGQKSRSGVSIKGFEGGQMPLYQRLPKRGFKNVSTKQYACINLGVLEKAFADKKLSEKDTINSENLIKAGIIKKAYDGVKILAKGTISVKATFDVAAISQAAKAAIEAAGGSVTVPTPVPLGDGKRAKRKAEAKAKWQARKDGTYEFKISAEDEVLPAKESKEPKEAKAE